MKTARILDADLEMDLRSLFVDQQENMNKATECLRVLSHPARLKILCILQQGERNVQEMEYFTGLKQATLSQHLSLLKLHNVLNLRREGNYSYYRIADERFQRLFEMLKSIFCQV
jgi:ArsR family transcriptional regulator